MITKSRFLVYIILNISAHDILRMEPRSDTETDSDLSVIERLLKVIVSIAVLVPVTVFFGYGGWIFLTVSAKLGVYDPQTTDGDPLRSRLLEWPDRNRDVLRTNGRADLPLKP